MKNALAIRKLAGKAHGHLVRREAGGNGIFALISGQNICLSSQRLGSEIRILCLKICFKPLGSCRELHVAAHTGLIDPIGMRATARRSTARRLHNSAHHGPRHRCHFGLIDKNLVRYNFLRRDDHAFGRLRHLYIEITGAQYARIAIGIGLLNVNDRPIGRERGNGVEHLAGVGIIKSLDAASLGNITSLETAHGLKRVAVGCGPQPREDARSGVFGEPGEALFYRLAIVGCEAIARLKSGDAAKHAAKGPCRTEQIGIKSR